MKKILIIVATVLVLGGLGFGGFALFANFSEGYRVGTITKLSHKGLVFKTWEGQMNVGGISTNDEGDVIPSIWEFSMYRSDNDLRSQIDDAVIGGYQVKLYYQEKFYTFRWRGDTKYFVTKVEKVEEQ